MTWEYLDNVVYAYGLVYKGSVRGTGSLEIFREGCGC